jgi:signal-transduction protein with cAMP-binding, CBS, and nucleotidyltransferase domain
MENAVEAIMSRKVETIDISESAQGAAWKMRDHKISSLVVLDKGKKGDPIGIVTERDLVYRICAEGTNSKDIRVQEIMSSPIATIDQRSTVEGAADLMLSNKVRHLLVVNVDKKPIGIVAPTDLNRYLRANIDMDEVKARILKAVLEGEEMGEPYSE